MSPRWVLGMEDLRGQTQALLEGAPLQGTRQRGLPTPSPVSPGMHPCFLGPPMDFVPPGSSLWSILLANSYLFFKPWLKYPCFQEALPDIPSQCPWPGILGKICC